MQRILILGAGRSSAHLIRYLLDKSIDKEWIVRIGDLVLANAVQKGNNHPNASAFAINADDDNQCGEEINQSDLVISMLPASMHIDVAKDCIKHKKPLITPSYVAPEMWELDSAAKANGVLILNEMGVDPGIDHMSAMQIIHRLQRLGARLESFESFTGGLIAPESDNNPWNYKITWNPRNVVLAGYGGTARFQQNGHLKFIPYHRLFERITPVKIEGHGGFDGYANRDSLKYKEIYNLPDIPTLYRGTLRKEGFCAAWNALVQLGLTDDSFEIENPGKMNWRELTASFIDSAEGGNLESRVQSYLKADDVVMTKLKWLGIFENNTVGIEKGSPAVALQTLIEKKWALEPGDKDLIVMWHRFYYEHDGKKHQLESYLVTPGEDPVYTAMSKTVGLPMAIAARLILDGTFRMTGVQLPVTPEIYDPIMHELHQFGISFVEKEQPAL
ncbi:MAG: saccharopine dehydrogenase family protein [Flavobacteriales bacterium]